jgi:hypothetical protein
VAVLYRYASAVPKEKAAEGCRCSKTLARRLSAQTLLAVAEILKSSKPK